MKIINNQTKGQTLLTIKGINGELLIIESADGKISFNVLRHELEKALRESSQEHMTAKQKMIRFNQSAEASE